MDYREFLTIIAHEISADINMPGFQWIFNIRATKAVEKKTILKEQGFEFWDLTTIIPMSNHK